MKMVGRRQGERRPLRRARRRGREARRPPRRQLARRARDEAAAAVVAGAGPDPIDFGLVGDVAGVNRALLALLRDAGYVPVLACLGCDDNGDVYNINADIVANQRRGRARRAARSSS